MKTSIFIIGIFILTLASNRGIAQNVPVKQVMDVPADFSISESEWRLYLMITEYRRQVDLTPIPLSKSLCFVARTHVMDLFLHHPDEEPCNAHSWSANGPWKPFCYPADEGKKGSVWDKPKELSKYNGKGYEIVYWVNNPVTIDSVIGFWKSIDYFNSFLMNTGKWQGKRWNAIGIGIYENYAVAWFGEVPDPEGVPSTGGKQAQKTSPPPVNNQHKADTSPAVRDTLPASFIDAGSTNSPKPVVPATPRVAGQYYIVVKSQLTLDESNKLADSLKQKGYPEAKVIQSNGKVRVVLFEAPNRNSANQKLTQARMVYKDAWILVP